MGVENIYIYQEYIMKDNGNKIKEMEMENFI